MSDLVVVTYIFITKDLEEFIKAPLVREMFAQMLGGPFFTSVPSGRVGVSKDFETNEVFVKALQQAERIDRSKISHSVLSSEAHIPFEYI